MKVVYTPSFVRMYKKLCESLKEETREKISLFEQDHTHSFLKVHKLKGSLKNRWSFSINYEYRIVFQYLSKSESVFLAIGNHDVYKD